jgi:cobalt-zinc-cadmium resistance protein CzcA
MNKLIKNIIGFSLKNKAFTLFMALFLTVAGVVSYLNTPIEAFPDVTNTQIIVVTSWKGRSAEEIERFVSIPIEVAMNSVQRKTTVRSITMFGLSVIKIIFEDDVDDFFARQQVYNQLKSVSLPEGVEPVVQPPYGPTGEIFRYVLTGQNRSTIDLLTIQNWVIDRYLRAVPGVADVVAFGGQEKIYEIRPNPSLLVKYGITPLELFEAVEMSNLNVGGDILQKNGQAYVVRGIGLLNSIDNINNIIVDNHNNVPVLIKHVADVVETGAPRVGQVGWNENDDVVEGIIVMRKGENPSAVLKRVKEKIAELHLSVLPSDVKMETFYDRDILMGYCTETVLFNLTEGIVFVILIVFLFLADIRTTIIVSIIIPMSLLFAFMCLRMMGMSANLLSLGAIDFGILVDGAVVMVEGLFVALDHMAHKNGMEKFNKLSKLGLIKKTSSGMGKSLLFAQLIILIALMPIFSFEKVEGKMFTPLAFTFSFALLGALLFTLTLVPLLVSMMLNKNVRERNNPFVNFIQGSFSKAYYWTYKHKLISLTVAVMALVATLFSTRYLGTEFLPTLNEGALWVEAKMPMSMSLPETVKMVHTLRKELNSFPEVNGVLSQTGRSNDGTDPSGFYYVQMQVNLKPKKEWTRKITQDELVVEMDKKLKNYQGINFNYSQPIIDNVAEAVAGLNANNAVKIFGPDIKVLDSLATLVLNTIRDVPGIKDIGVLRNTGQPEVQVILNELKMAQYGVTVEEALNVVELAFGSKTATVKYEGEKKFEVRVRYPEDFRENEEDILNLLVPTIHGNSLPLSEIASINKITGPGFIYRDNNRRFIGVKFSVRERDLGGTISEAQFEVAENIKLPEGYTIGWAGEFENQVRATNQLAISVPISFAVIFLLLVILFGNLKDAGLVLLNVPFAVIGGIMALHITGTNFGISVGVGFIALFGVVIQNGAILISVFKSNREAKLSLEASVKEGVKARIRPVVMTAVIAAIGLLPAALSTGIGSESQRPLAIVVIGGFITSTILTLLIFPNIYYLAYRRSEKKKIKKIENLTKSIEE